MLPRSPPLPLTQSTVVGSPVSGSGWLILELVLPPAKLVRRRSRPSKFERYRSSSASSNPLASASSHKSCKYLNGMFAHHSNGRNIDKRQRREIDLPHAGHESVGDLLCK